MTDRYRAIYDAQGSRYHAWIVYWNDGGHNYINLDRDAQAHFTSRSLPRLKKRVDRWLTRETKRIIRAQRMRDEIDKAGLG